MGFFFCWRRNAAVAAEGNDLAPPHSRHTPRDASRPVVDAHHPPALQHCAERTVAVAAGAAEEPDAFRVTVRRGNGVEYEVVVRPTLTCEELQRILSKVIRLPPFALRLIHKRKILLPHATMEDAEVTPGVTMYMVVVMDGATKWKEEPPPSPTPRSNHSHYHLFHRRLQRSNSHDDWDTISVAPGPE
ncbi:hypothetical protein AB1Y20_003545 [Prymnesium parvum]|uniref:Ubiquitin-like domain-containing protein n=1 Tax=Prymnesium parvum TaxID=97485 RepID=A0AB34J6X2_PRYPA